MAKRKLYIKPHKTSDNRLLGIDKAGVIWVGSAKDLNELRNMTKSFNSKKLNAPNLVLWIR